MSYKTIKHGDLDTLKHGSIYTKQVDEDIFHFCEIQPAVWGKDSNPIAWIVCEGGIQADNHEDAYKSLEESGGELHGDTELEWNEEEVKEIFNNWEAELEETDEN
jgi:hypothetical protein